MKKTFKIILVIIFFVIIICILYFNFYRKYIFAVNLNWNLNLPFEDKAVYVESLPPSFLGDGPRYAILKYASKSKIKKLNSIPWISNKNIVIEDEVSKILSKLEIDDKYMIPFNQEYLYYHCIDKDDKRNHIYMFYFINEGLIYVVEEFW